MDKEIIIYILLIAIAILIASIVVIIGVKNKKIQEVSKYQRIAPGSVRKNTIWVDTNDPVYANEDDADPFTTIGELIRSNLPESKFLEVNVQFHAVDDQGRLRIQTETGYAWLEPINQKASYTISSHTQQQP